MEETNTIEGGQVDNKREKMNVALALVILVVAVGASYFILTAEGNDSDWRAELEAVREWGTVVRVGTITCDDSVYSLTDDLSRYSYEISSDYSVVEGVAHWGGVAIPELDPETFESISSFHYKDKNNVWFEILNESGDPSDLVLVSAADPASFEILIEGYASAIARDKEHVFFNHISQEGNGIIEGVDPADFVVLGDRLLYAKDKVNVYHLAGAYTETDPVVVIEGADPDTFSICGEDYVKDVDTVWHQSGARGLIILDGVDAETFEVMDTFANFAKDKDNIYTKIYTNNLSNIVSIVDADPETFVLLPGSWPGSHYAKDRFSVWYLWRTVQKVENADAETFVDLGEGKAKDKNRSYQDGQPI